MNRKCFSILFLFSSVCFFMFPSLSFPDDLQTTREYLLQNSRNVQNDSTAPLGTFANPAVKKEESDITDNDLIQAVRTAKGPAVDVKMQIVQKIAAVRHGDLTPEDFYKQVSALEMPAGKEVRHVLMEVKKDIGNYLGKNGLRKVFGELYSSGGSEAESMILSHRKNVVMETIGQVVKDFADADLKFTVYYSEVGGWPNEGPKDMKFAGDIDFNFLCGDLETAMKLKKAYDAYIVKRYGRTPEDLDIPCTVHGMATGEVYVGKKGQSFAEGVTKSAKKINFNEDGKGVRLEEPVPFKRALGNMLAEAEFSKIPLANLEALKWPTEPGVSLEMIRHFEHDIVGQNVYTDLESFVKAAKYTDRSFSALEKDVGAEAIKDTLLRKLTEQLVAAKSNPKAQVDLLKAYYQAKGKPLPFDAELDINASGKTEATLKYNQELIKEFWKDCRKTMWESANNKLKKVVSDFKKHAGSMEGKDPQEVKILYDELNKYNEMMEIENRVLTDAKAGLHDKMNAEYQKLMGEFRDVVKEFKKQAAKHDYLKVIDPAKGDTYKFVDGQLKLDNKYSVRMAAAALAQAPGTVNDILDYFDDTLLNRLRYGEAKNFDQFLRSGQKAFWDDQADYFMGEVDVSKYPEHTRQSKLKVTKISEELTNDLQTSLASRGLKMITRAGGAVTGGIQSVNNAFNQSVSSSAGGQAMMQGMMIYNLSQEIPIYIDLYVNEKYEDLAMEFFKRRLPFVSAAERAYMGDYYGVAWEVTSMLLPPAAIFSAAKSVGESLGQTAWDTYWDEELESFIDNLYDKAEFKAVGVETTGDNIKISDWQLVSVTYNSITFDFNELIQTEINGAREMAACLQKPSEKRAECFPMEKVSDGLFQWWQTETAFEEKFKRTDPWIQLITEMAEAPHVGKKLKDYFYYQKQTRWEQIKVDFLKKLRKTLQDRRAGEQTLVSGAFLKMYEELLLVAGKLDIRPQVQTALDEEFGGAVSEAMDYIKDLLRGTVREINNDVDIWDRYEDISTYVTAALRTYKRIWDGRKNAEGLLPISRHDQGLRLLTGPYFLKGVYSDDDSAAEKWFSLPLDVNKKMFEELAGIKGSSDADPSELDIKEGSYDTEILNQLVYHDSFREMWKHVNGSFVEAGVASYLGREESQQSVPNSEDVKTDQDRALERFHFHAQRVEELLKAFREHYGLKQEDALTELRSIRDRIAALASEICADCTSANAGMGALEGITGSVAEEVTTFEEKVNEVLLIFKSLDAMKSDLESAHGTAESLATRIGEASVLAGESRDSVCQAAESMQNCKTNGERDQLYGQAVSAHAQITSAFNTARGEYSELEGIGKSAKEKLDKLEKAQKTAREISDIPEGITTADKDVLSSKEKAQALIQGAVDKFAELKTFQETAQSLEKEIRQVLKSQKTEESKSLLEEMKDIMGETASQVKTASGCLKRAEKEQKEFQKQADKFTQRVSLVKANLQKIHQAFLPDGQGNDPEIFAIALEKANLIDLLSSMGKGYIEACTEHLLMAKVCMNEAERLSTVDFSAFMPDIAGMTCQEGCGAVAGNKISYQIVSKGKAAHPDWEYRVESTDPAGGVEVSLRETTVLISCYEDLNIPAYLATIDCRPIPGSTAVYDAGQRRGVCDCVNGVIFNPSRTRCINCNDYYQGFAAAFNAGDLDNAQAWVNEARACPWAPEAQGQIDAERQRRACFQIANALYAACQNNNAAAASGLLGEAVNWQCNIHPDLWQWANNIIAAHNDRVRQEQIQQQQLQQQQMQNFMNAMNDMVNQMNNTRHQGSSSSGGVQVSPGVTTQTPSIPTSGTSGGGTTGASSGGSADPCAGCRGMCLLGVCQD